MDDDRQTLALRLLTQAAAEHPRGKAGVAQRLGYGRALISRTLSPNDPLQISEQLVNRVIDRLHVIPECPAIYLPRPYSDCRRIAQGPAPTHNPASMFVWRTCQTCPHKPEGKS